MKDKINGALKYTKGMAALKIQMAKPIKSIYFDDPPPEDEDRFNPSDIISLTDSRFLFCDNNVGHALYELRFRPEGKKKGAFVFVDDAGGYHILWDDDPRLK
jgi:hypothetical protein